MKEFDNTADVFITKGNTEESMEQLTKNIGVYFSNPLRLLGEEGWIKVYNNETNALIETFTKENWSKYNKQSPYYYEEAIKHIRIETSKGHSGGELNVYHVKELDDTYITSHYTKEKFDNLEHIQSHLHGMVQDSTIGNGEVHYIQTGVYKAPTSMAEIKMENPKMATQEASDRKIVISTKSTTIVEQQWKNGSFLVKLPSNIIQAKVNSIATNTTKVKIIGYDLYKDAGNYYIKVLTENEEEATYNIVIDCNLTPDPIGLTETKPIELYASNEIGIYYQNSAADQYDVNNNLNTKENVNYSITNISFIAPTSLITSQTGSEFDNKGSIVRAPQIAEITKAQRTAKINVQIANNYGSTVSEMLVLGKIPFAGNRTTLTNQELGSTYTATMNNTGIQVPAELARYATVYYSENENPTKDLQDSNNGWKTKNEVTNWNNIKTYLIDFGNYVMAKGTTHTFIYEIHVPEGLEYGNVAYSTHVVYFSLDTEHGKYRTQTEPNKLGFIVDKKFDLEITKYQENTEKLLPKVTYMITEEGTENSKIKTTDENGKISIAGLYVGRIYHIKEIKTPSDYELKEEVVKFRTTADEEDNVHVEILEGNIRASETVKEESWKVKVALDNTVKAKLKINKKDETGVPLGNIKFKINGKGNDNVFIRTGANGEVSLQGICLNEEYTLEEVQADGYYFIDRISFKITNQEGEFVLEILSGNVEQEEITIENEIPTINFEIQNERIPTYDLEIVKVKKNSETEKIKGVQFKLEGERIEKPQYYFTDENGKITIPELYQYVEGKNLEAKYTLTEVFAPEGYVTDTTPIVFKVQEIDGNLQLQQESGTIKTNVVDGNKVTLTIENSPIFNLTKYTEEGREKVNLPNAKFMIYTLDENRNVIGQAKDTKGNIIDTVSTDAQGEISIGLPQGIYKVIETEAPEGYQLPEKEEDRTYYFGVGASLPVKTELKKTNENSYGGPKDEKVVSIEATNDRGYIIGGQRYDGGPKGILIKYDNKGNVQWDKEISETYNNSVKYIMSARNGDYIVSGWFRSDTLNLGNNVTITKNTSESECYMLIRYNSKGIAIWAKAIGDKSITRMAESSDGKIFAIDSNNTISKFSDTGDLVWEKQIQRSSNIIGTSDKGVVVGGYFSVDSITIDNKITLTKQGNQDAFIVKFDENGTIKWTKQFGESGKVATLGVFSETKDRNIIIGIKGLGKIIKCDNNNGEIYWTEQEPEKGISYITDNGYLGVKNSAGCRIVKYDNNMNIEWEKYLSVDALIGSESFQKISDREFVLVITYGGYKDYIQVDKGNRFISNGGKDIATFKLEEVETAPQIPEMQSIEVENTRKQYNITTEIAPNEAGQRVGGTVTGIYNETYPEANNKKYIETVSHGKNATQNIEITPNTDYVVKEVTLNGQKVNFVPDTEGKVILPALENVTEDKHYVIVFDNTIGQILVHHYIDGTTTKVAEDETSQGTIGESYTTSPKVDLAQYELKKLEDGEYQIPENATGTYKSELQEIIYYYVKKQIPLTVHHYIEGTTQSVPLKDGSIAQDEQRLGQENEEYTTNAKSAEELDSKYELVEMPENANGVYTYDEVIVTYYYKLKTVNITTRVEKHIETNELGEEVEVAGGSITGEGQTPYETVVYTENSVKDIIATPEEGYKVAKIAVNGEEIEFTANEDKTVTLDKFINMTEDKEVVVTFEKIPAKLIVHHYIDGTTTKVPSKEGGEVQDEQRQGEIGNIYATQKSDKIAPNYECVEEVPEKASGKMTEELIEVIYYYKLKNETVETEITKTATASKIVEKEENGEMKQIAVLTQEDGEVSYTISHKVKITDYIGKAKVRLTDTLPAKIDLSKSDLAEGSYDEATNTITWEETIENIDTYTTNGEFNKTITKNIKVVYVDQDVTKVLVNKVAGSVTTYYPESYTPKPGEEKETVTKETEEKVEQEYKVDKTVEKIWEDNENSKGKRPQGIKVQLTGNGANEVEGTVLEQVILSEENSWSHTYTNLPKYDSEGQIIAYTAQESEVNVKDLEYYESAQVVVNGDKITVTNPYKETNTTTESTIEKTGTEKVTASNAPVTYNINYNATIKDYIGEATVTIVDTLPYKIDTEAEALELNGGVYNEEAQTITWIENLGHINTFENGDRVVNLSKEITVVYKDIDKTLESMTNYVKGTVTFGELETKDETEDETDTLINIKGKVVVKYVDEETGEEIKYTNEEGKETTYGYEYEDKVGTDYGTNKKEIEGYEYVRVEGSETGKIEEGTTEVTYYYRRKRVKIVTMVQKHTEINEEGSQVEVAGGTISGDGEEAYEIVKYGENSTKDIIAVPEEGYRVSKITVNGEEIGFIEKADRTVEVSKFKHMTEDKVVIVEFARIPAKVIVHHYIEGTTTKVPSRTDGQVQDEEKEGYVGKAYTTTKSLEVSPNYECVKETPEKASGKMTEKTIEVIYYYRIKEETVETEVIKAATASKTVQKQENGKMKNVAVLTQEDGEVSYTISHRIKMTDYIGKAKVKLVDTLPAKIDLSKSDLAEGSYDEATNTITWEETIENIDTYTTNGEFNKTITKNIKVVYVDQDVTKVLVNKVAGSVTTYYPESYTPKPGEEKETVTKETEEKVEQEYKVDKTVEKIWEDNENSKGKRPQGIKVQLTGNGANEVEGTVLEQVILSEQNRWQYTFTNLPKYDNIGKTIKYSVKESEVNNKDLEYYEKAQVTTSGNKIIVTNEYKLVETTLDSEITKTATPKITASNMPVTYNISYNATIKEYIGEAILTITDTLPYKIDSVASELNGGVYNEDLQTITWTENLGHINTFETGNKEINIEKQIVVVYTNLDASKEKMTNHVKGKLEFTQNDTKNEVEDDADTLIEIKGQVIVKYVDIETNEEIAPGGQKEDKVGTTYGTIQKDIEHYEFVKVTGEPEGEIKEGITEVIYYYKKIPKGKVVVKYVDEEGNEIAPGGQKEDYVGEEYKTKQKDIENYEFVEVTGEPEGEIKEGITEVIYHYKKIKTDLVVRYLEKGTNKPLLEEEHKEGYVGDSYTTTRKEVTNYKPASPEPENAKGKLVKGTTYVTYYYEKIQPGKVIVKYVDIETKEELIDKGENKPYGYEKEDEVGEKYTTEEKNIPYYEYVKEQEPENKNGTIKEGSTTVIYYYRKLPFNIGVDKTIKEIRVNGEKLGNKQGKDLLKVEVVGSKINETEVVVTYSIVVRNTGKIDGTAELLERIPKGYTIEEKTSKEWKKTKDGNLTANINLKAGEEKELEVVLRWKNGNSNLGQMSNTVEITKTSNPAGYKETTIEDNKSEADVLMSVKTGVGKNVIATVLVAVIAVGMLGAYHTILIKDLKKKEE